jgi:Holliday junction resolvase-like predicted endonuclease
MKEMFHVTRVSKKSSIDPKKNVHPKKLERFIRTVEYYLMEQNVPSPSKETEEMNWQVDLLCIYIDTETKNAQVKLLEQIV